MISAYVASPSAQNEKKVLQLKLISCWEKLVTVYSVLKTVVGLPTRALSSVQTQSSDKTARLLLL